MTLASSTMTPEQAIDAYHGTVCPGCQMIKAPRTTLCNRCFEELGVQLQETLSRPPGHTMAKWLGYAVNLLKTKERFTPKGRRHRGTH